MSASAAADWLVVGSGIAGLRAAVALQGHGRVLILTKADPTAGSTGYAQGGIAAAVGADDSPALHAADTIAAGDGLCDERAVQVLVGDGPRYVRELIDWGAAFDRTGDGALDLAREGAHSVRRVLHAADATGREIGRVLASQLDRSAVTVIDHAVAVRVIVEDGRCAGVGYLDAHGHARDARAAATLLATGGAGRIFRESTNPPVATGDGIALAYLAGARVSDLEFVQFHPTALAVPGAPRYLLSEALRGEGATLINAAGEPFMPRYDPAGDLAPRDRVARAILRESARTEAPVFLTLAHLPADVVHARFPVISGLCARAGLDLATDRLPVSPAAHYMMGGVATDLDGRTSLAGLFAAGEAACTGVHGANRLASNSLLEGLVFGGRAADAMRADLPDRPAEPTGTTAPARRPPGGLAASSSVQTDAALADLLWNDAGVFRTRDGLTRALAAIGEAWPAVRTAAAEATIASAADWHRACLVTVGRLVVAAALRREESRGAHWRADFPARDDLHWNRHFFDALP